MAARDNDLLARLNALKPSSVKLEPPAASVDIEVNKPVSVEDKLASRLKALRSPGSAVSNGDTSRPGTNQKADALTAQIRDEVATEDRDPIRNWQEGDEGDSQTLEDLLAELGPDDQWKLNPDEPKHVEALLKEARDALPADEVETPHEDHSEVNPKDDSEDREDGAQESRTEEQEADEYVKKVLAEVDLETKYGGAEDEHETNAEPGNDTTVAGLQLPSTPQNLLSKPDDDQAQSQEDSELEARFSKLGLDLPSTPTNKPSSQAKATPKGKVGAKPPVYTDEDMDSWCCICNEDGEVRCLGCDNDIYCQSCWREGHGNGPGQEVGHRAVQYTRKCGGMAAA